MSQYVHDAWSADRGFVGGAVNAICQSADGYLWIGTERGLVRFDGFTFSLIQRPIADSPPIGAVRGLVADASGNLWIRVDGPHLLLYRDGRFEDAFKRFGLEEVTFTAMVRDINGGLLLSGLSNRAMLFRDGRFQEILSAQETTGMVISLAETRDGKIWMGTRDDGLFRVSQGNLSKATRDLADTKINAMVAANSGGLWVGTDAGLDFLDADGLVKTKLPSGMSEPEILALTKDHDAIIWLGTDHGLARRLSAGGGLVEVLGSSSQSKVAAVYEDRDGAIWFGGPKGLERLRDGVFTTYSAEQGLPGEDSGPVFVDKDARTWFAPLSGGLF